MITEDKITEIFCIIDDFCKEFYSTIDTHSIVEDSAKKRRKRASVLSDSEVITIMVYFHACNARCLKHFYINYVCRHMQAYFPKTVSYNRFVELQKKSAVIMGMLLKTLCLGRCTGISFIDSTPLRSCHIKREKQHKTMRGIAEKGQCSLGWFYGFKLHLIINDRGELLDFMMTRGNVDDRKPLSDNAFHKRIFGKLFGDKGYISKDLFEQMFTDGVHMVTKIKKNMKNSLMHIHDKLMLKKRALIESVNDELKNICQIEHTRHRSFDNFVTNLLSGLIAYSFFPKKPSLNLEIIDNKRIAVSA